MNNVLVARQPVISRSLRTLGFELLFRSSQTDTTASIVDGDAATATVVSNAIGEIGLDGIVGDGIAFVNVTAHFLTERGLLDVLPPERCVLEILEDTDVTDEVVSGVERLVERGYTFAMDDFDRWGPTAPLLKYASYVKYDHRAVHGDALLEAIEVDHDADRRVVIERIETHHDHEAAALAGADYFQGYFFARPTTMTATSISANALILMRLLTRINQPNTSLDEIIDVLSQDVAMSVKTLKYVNSAAYGLGGGVDSIRHAAVLVGRDSLRCWTMLELMTALGDKPIELARLALIRARFCELVALRRGLPQADSFYTVGMLSLLDAMTDTPMALVTERIAVADSIRSALLGEDSPFTAVLTLAIAIEQQTSQIAGVLSDRDMVADHREATAWANGLFTETTRRIA